MNEQQTTEPVNIQITPFAILAAILFNLQQTETIKIKLDDSPEEAQVQAPCMGLERTDTDDAIVVQIPIEKILKFAQVQYDFQFKVEKGIAIVSFEKHVFTQSDIYAANGQKIVAQSKLIEELLERFK